MYIYDSSINEYELLFVTLYEYLFNTYYNAIANRLVYLTTI